MNEVIVFGLSLIMAFLSGKYYQMGIEMRREAKEYLNQAESHRKAMQIDELKRIAIESPTTN